MEASICVMIISFNYSCFRVRPAFLPLLSKISGSSIVLQTFWRMVVFPALARPMMSMRKQRYFDLYSLSCSLALPVEFAGVDRDMVSA